jgi:hypothetical protein
MTPIGSTRILIACESGKGSPLYLPGKGELRLCSGRHSLVHRSYRHPASSIAIWRRPTPIGSTAQHRRGSTAALGKALLALIAQ